MLYEFQQRIKKLSSGKKKLLLNKMNTYVTLDEKIWMGYKEEQCSKILIKQDKVREQFICIASLLLDEGKTLKETYSLLKKGFSCSSAQYGYYTAILERYEGELTQKGRKAYDAHVMGKSLTQKNFLRSVARVAQRG